MQKTNFPFEVIVHDDASTDKTPVAKFVSERILTLTLYADLSLKDVNRICDIILK